MHHWLLGNVMTHLNSLRPPSVFVSIATAAEAHRCCSLYRTYSPHPPPSAPPPPILQSLGSRRMEASQRLHVPAAWGALLGSACLFLPPLTPSDPLWPPAADGMDGFHLPPVIEEVFDSSGQCVLTAFSVSQHFLCSFTIKASQETVRRKVSLCQLVNYYFDHRLICRLFIRLIRPIYSRILLDDPLNTKITF